MHIIHAHGLSDVVEVVVAAMTVAKTWDCAIGYAISLCSIIQNFIHLSITLRD